MAVRLERFVRPVVDGELISIKERKLPNDIWLYMEGLGDLAGVPTLIYRQSVLCSSYDEADRKRIGLSE
ncbi:hypothetical protein [Nitrosomonas eutropha]|uniref:hypothetical protein n=1 Tax=Nitrosomonas eutropha TaxID=916 RepID=UPI0011609D1B|nr:hypothetical protein [Nitrosomonas eutropha]